jgi:hypothetical protein
LRDAGASTGAYHTWSKLPIGEEEGATRAQPGGSSVSDYIGNAERGCTRGLCHGLQDYVYGLEELYTRRAPSMQTIRTKNLILFGGAALIGGAFCRCRGWLKMKRLKTVARIGARARLHFGPTE